MSNPLDHDLVDGHSKTEEALALADEAKVAVEAAKSYFEELCPASEYDACQKQIVDDAFGLLSIGLGLN
eukprot:gene5349-5331_t